MPPIRTLIAEDSATVRELLRGLLGSDPEFEIVGCARDGLEAVAMTAELRPDVVTMDIRMPQLDGFEATRRIMTDTPTPIVIVSGNVDVREVEVSMKAIELGALALLPKPISPVSPDYDAAARRFLSTVKAMSAVKVVHRWRERDRDVDSDQPWHRPSAQGPTRTQLRPRILAIATSTGGPPALQTVLSHLGTSFALPILVVQHIGSGFTEGLRNWLDSVVELEVKLAQDGETLRPGVVYLAPDDRHLGVADTRHIRLSSETPRGAFRPSADFLFESVADTFGASSLAVILTGMGRDGVEGLRAVRRRNGHIIAQDQESSLVFGMPGETIAAGLPDQILPLNSIASYLIEILKLDGDSHGQPRFNRF